MSILVGTPDGHTAEFPDGTDPSIIQKAMAAQFGAPKAVDQTSSAAFNPAGDSFFGNLPAAIGQGITDVGTGANQLLANLPAPAFLPPDIAQQAQQQVRGDANKAATLKAKIDAPLLAAPGGTTGNMIGNTIGTALIPGGPLAQGAFAAAVQPVANAGEQDIASLVSGKKPVDYWGEKLPQIGIGAATGYGTQKVLQGVGKLAEKLLPQNMVGSVLNAFSGKAADTPFAQEGEALADRTGIGFTPGQVTGAKGLMSIENRVRGLASSSDIAFQGDAARAQQWTDYVNRTIDGIGERGGSAADVGQRVQGVVKNAVSDMTAARDTAASKDYGAIRTLLEGKPAIVPQNYLGKLQELGQEFAGGPEGSDYAKLSRTLGSLQETGLQNADVATMMKTRRFLSQVAGGQVQLAGDTGRGLQKSVATQLLGAIDQDLDASAAKLGGPVGDMLKQANSTYRAHSQAIEGLQNSALGKLVGEDFANAVGSGTFNQIPGEAVMQRLGTLKPSQLAAAKGILQQYSPETLQAVKSYTLEDALAKAQQAAPSDGANTLAARPNVFLNVLAKTPEDRQRLAALFEPKELGQVNDAFAAGKRLSDKTGSNFSGTASTLQSYEYARAIGSLVTGNPAPLAAMTGLSLSSKSIANIMSNAQGRALIPQLAKLPPGSARFTQLASQITAIAAGQAVNPADSQLQQ